MKIINFQKTLMQTFYNVIKGSERQCIVVELRLQSSREVFRIHLRHIKRFKDL